MDGYRGVNVQQNPLDNRGNVQVFRTCNNRINRGQVIRRNPAATRAG